MLTIDQVRLHLPSSHTVLGVHGLELLCKTRCGLLNAPCVCITCGVVADHVIVWEAPNGGGKHRDPFAYIPATATKPSRLVMLTLDHILPKSKGGTNRESNLQVMCMPCNSAVKRNKISAEDWSKILLNPKDHVSNGKRRTNFIRALRVELGLQLSNLSRPAMMSPVTTNEVSNACKTEPDCRSDADVLLCSGVQC